MTLFPKRIPTMLLACFALWSLRVQAEGQEIALGVLVSGQIQHVYVQAGQTVKRGELLLSLAPQEFQARIDAATAQLQHAQAIQAEAQRELERAQALYEQGSLADHALQQAKIALLAARAEVSQAKQRQQEAKLALVRSRLHAPFDGKIIAVQSWPGQAVQNRCKIQPLLIFQPRNNAKIRRQDSTTKD